MSCVLQLPYFMNELALTALDMGFSIPKILHASKPSVDHQGRTLSLSLSLLSLLPLYLFSSPSYLLSFPLPSAFCFSLPIPLLLLTRGIKHLPHSSMQNWFILVIFVGFQT